MSIKDHLIKLTMWWQGAQKLPNDRPGGRPPPCPPSVSPLPAVFSADPAHDASRVPRRAHRVVTIGVNANALFLCFTLQ